MVNPSHPFRFTPLTHFRCESSWQSKIGDYIHVVPIVIILHAYAWNHEVLATEWEPAGQPRRAREDVEVRVAQSAAHVAEGINTRPNIAQRSKSFKSIVTIHR